MPGGGGMTADAELRAKARAVALRAGIPSVEVLAELRALLPPVKTPPQAERRAA